MHLLGRTLSFSSVRAWLPRIIPSEIYGCMDGGCIGRKPMNVCINACVVVCVIQLCLHVFVFMRLCSFA